MSATARIESYVRPPERPVQHYQPRWYAAHTSANREKRVAEQFQLRRIDHFLPVYSSVRRWKDRQVQLELPLFAGYVFVRLALRDRLQVLEVPGVARLVGFSGSAVALPDEEIDALRRSVGCGVRAAPHPYLTVGRRVRVMAGPLTGQEGILLRWKGNWRVVLSVELIQRSIAVEVDTATLEPAPS
jgi:transcription antitermination factor NusG